MDEVKLNIIIMPYSNETNSFRKVINKKVLYPVLWRQLINILCILRGQSVSMILIISRVSFIEKQTKE